MKVLRKVGLAVFNDKKVIMARDNKHGPVYLTLGGKVEPGESDVECVRRETMEEAGVDVDPASLKFLVEFEAPAHGKQDTLVNIRLYSGRLLGEPVPSSEVVEINFLDSTVNPEHLTVISRDLIFPWLKQQDLIN